MTLTPSDGLRVALRLVLEGAAATALLAAPVFFVAVDTLGVARFPGGLGVFGPWSVPGGGTRLFVTGVRAVVVPWWRQSVVRPLGLLGLRVWLPK